MPRPAAPARALVVGLALALAFASAALGHEGQWMPRQIHDLDPQMLRGLGLELSADQLWKDGDETSLLRAVVNLSGCSAAFLSRDGLISTNHHCGYRAIQAASSVEHDYLKDGFLAAHRARELEAKGLTVKVLQAIDDVTEEVRAAAAAATTDAERAKLVEQKKKELVAACEASGEVRCQVEGFYRGSLFQRFSFVELVDIRLVYAPPSSVGNYGGEIDNWMWPRHSGDFTLVRAYVGPDGKPAPFNPNNVPFHPKRWLEVSPEGVDEGTFVSTIGYPGETNRYLSSAEVRRHLEQVFPRVIEVYGEWMDLQEQLAAGSDARRIKVAGRLRSLANRHKNSRGMVDGILRMGLLERRQAEDDRLAALAKGRGAPWSDVAPALHALSSAERDAFEREFLLQTLLRGPDAVSVAVHLVRRARERQKPDLERPELYMDRDQDRLWRYLERYVGTFDPVVDAALLDSWLVRARALQDDQALAGLDGVTGQGVADGTALGDLAKVKALFDAADLAALEASPDPAIVLARALVPAYERMEADQEAREGQELLLGPRYFELLKEVRTGPVYPDANGTLRFSYATVQGYSPRDGMWALPQTTLAGQVAKHTGEDPFDLPARIREKASSAPATAWADPDLGDVPVCFLSNSDTTGGNSGSPVIDGKGRLVGFNFDRVWENIAGDFGYNPARSRNVIVDVRYLLWLLDDVEDAGGILTELGLAAWRDRPALPARVAAGPAAAGTTAVAGAPDLKRAAGCSTMSSGDPALLALGLLALLARRRRRGGSAA